MMCTKGRRDLDVMRLPAFTLYFDVLVCFWKGPARSPLDQLALHHHQHQASQTWSHLPTRRMMILWPQDGRTSEVEGSETKASNKADIIRSCSLYARYALSHICGDV